METLLYNLFIYFSQAIILWQYTSKMLTPRRSKRMEALVLAGLYMGLFFISFTENSWLKVISFLCANFLFIGAMHDIKWLSALFHATITTITMGMSELFIQTTTSYALPDFYAKRMYFRNMFILEVLSKMLYYLILSAFSCLFVAKDKHRGRSDHSTIFLFSVPTSSMYIMLTFLAICEQALPSRFLDSMISFSAIFLLAINLLISAAYGYIQKRDMEFTEMQLAMQREHDSMEYYKMLQQQNESQRILIHDIRKHLQSIALLNENGDSGKITSYIDRIVHSPDLQGSIHLCDHELLNAILCRYKRQCQDLGIHFCLDIRSGIVDFITDNDLTSLFCNLLDNAIEAASDTPEALIDLRVARRENTSFSVLTMTNSCQENPFSVRNHAIYTMKPDKSKHGFGLKSIQRIAEAYGGNMQMYHDPETATFHTIIALKLPNE